MMTITSYDLLLICGNIKSFEKKLHHVNRCFVNIFQLFSTSVCLFATKEGRKHKYLENKPIFPSSIRNHGQTNQRCETNEYYVWFSFKNKRLSAYLRKKSTYRGSHVFILGRLNGTTHTNLNEITFVYLPSLNNHSLNNWMNRMIIADNLLEIIGIL